MPLYRANRSCSRSTRSQIGDISEVGVGNTGVRISVARNVECIEGVEAEADRLLSVMWKSLKADMSIR